LIGTINVPYDLILPTINLATTSGPDEGTMFLKNKIEQSHTSEVLWPT